MICVSLQSDMMQYDYSQSTGVVGKDTTACTHSNTSGPLVVEEVSDLQSRSVDARISSYNLSSCKQGRRSQSGYESERHFDVELLCMMKGCKQVLGVLIRREFCASTSSSTTSSAVHAGRQSNSEVHAGAMTFHGASPHCMNQ